MQNQMIFNSYECSVLMNESPHLLKLYFHIKSFCNPETGISTHPNHFKCKNLINLVSFSSLNGHQIERKTRWFVLHLLEKLVTLNLIEILDKNSFLLKNSKIDIANTNFSHTNISPKLIQTVDQNLANSEDLPTSSTNLDHIQHNFNTHPVHIQDTSSTNPAQKISHINHSTYAIQHTFNTNLTHIQDTSSAHPTQLQDTSRTNSTQKEKFQKERGSFSPPRPPSISPQRKKPTSSSLSLLPLSPADASWSKSADASSDDEGDVVFKNFKTFWEHFPAGKRVHRQRAFGVWLELECDAQLPEILEDLKRRPWPVDPRYIPMPENYLRDRRWLDQQAQEAPKSSPKEAVCCEYDRHFDQPDSYKMLCTNKDLAPFGGVTMCRFHQELLMSRQNRGDKRVRHLVAMQIRSLRSEGAQSSSFVALSSESEPKNGGVPIRGFLSGVLKNALARSI